MSDCILAIKITECARLNIENSPSNVAAQLKLEDAPEACQQPCQCLAVLV